MNNIEKLKEVECAIPVSLLLNLWYWDIVCDDYWYNPWAINEWLMDDDQTVSVKLKDVVRYWLTNKF